MEINNRFLIGDKVKMNGNFNSIVGKIVAIVVFSQEDVRYMVDYFDKQGRKATEIFKVNEIAEEYES